jgi:hypothetical protein
MKTLQRRFAPTPAAISETGGRNGTKSLAELSEIPTWCNIKNQRSLAKEKDGGAKDEYILVGACS